MLSELEKVAGRQFQSDCSIYLQCLNETEPPTYDVPFYLGIYRHLCEQRAGRSTAIELKEIYLLSPGFGEQHVPAGRFGFIFRAGRCRACGHTARSRAGRIVDALERPPLERSRHTTVM